MSFNLIVIKKNKLSDESNFIHEFRHIVCHQETELQITISCFANCNYRNKHIKYTNYYLEVVLIDNYSHHYQTGLLPYEELTCKTNLI